MTHYDEIEASKRDAVIEYVEDQIAAAETSRDAVIIGLRDQLVAADSDIAAKVSTISTLSSQLSEQSGLIGSLKAEIDILDEAVEDSDVKINLLTADKETLTAVIASIRAELAERENMVAFLQSEIGQADQEIANLHENIDTLASELPELEAQIDGLEAQVALLQSQSPAQTGVLTYWGAPAWRDEFDYKDANGNPAINPANWNVRERADLGLTIDAAIPDKSMATVDANGILHLRAEWLPDAPQTRSASATGVTILTHRTAYLDHRGLKPGNVTPYAQQYGRWEIRAKVPTGPRTWGALAAFWLRGTTPGEIDIMESWGYGDVPRAQRPGTSTTTVHTNTSGSGVKKFWPLEEVLATKLGSAKLPDVHLDFHTWALEFTPKRFTMILDGVEVFTTTPSASPDFWNPSYFGSPLHVRLNLHVGPDPTYWGLPDPAHKELTQNLDFQVEYVRIYAMPS
jgi:beta-glucanase (GH16 family)/uncharacterized coiled-coil protein SlyX